VYCREWSGGTVAASYQTVQLAEVARGLWGPVVLALSGRRGRECLDIKTQGNVAQGLLWGLGTPTSVEGLSQKWFLPY